VLATPDANVLNACRTLFGTEAAVSREFLLSLKPNVLKTAFRKKAKETHPDLFTAHDPHVQMRQAKMFHVVNEAYDIMRKYCELRVSVYTLPRALECPELRTRPQHTPGELRGQQRGPFALPRQAGCTKALCLSSGTRSVVTSTTADAYPIKCCSRRFRGRCASDLRWGSLRSAGAG
jgi:hypothetical protein